MIKPTLKIIFETKVDECNETECDNCDSYESIPETRIDPACHICSCIDETQCSAAERIFALYEADYLEEQESLNHE